MMPKMTSWVEVVASIVVGGTVLLDVVVVASMPNWMSSRPIDSNSPDCGTPHPTATAVTATVMPMTRRMLTTPR
jgi:hypothetical protein